MNADGKVLTNTQRQKLCASVPSAKQTRVLKWIGGAFAGVTLSIAMTAWFGLPLGPFLDDGPFHGTPTAAMNNQAPDQLLPIWGGDFLEVFDSTTEGVSATVQLRSANHTVRWAILADGYKPGDVRSVRFKKAYRGMARSGVVYGMADWTYGNEATCCFITGSGGLRDYWYSW